MVDYTGYNHKYEPINRNFDQPKQHFHIHSEEGRERESIHQLEEFHAADASKIESLKFEWFKNKHFFKTPPLFPSQKEKGQKAISKPES